jgi:L-threonylcarbamoyladenylate synthase
MSLFYDCSSAEDRNFGLDAAADAIRRGELVVLPTDTVYGVGVDAFSPEAVTDLLAAKGRGREMPPPVLVGSWEGLDGLVLSVDAVARDLIEAFWPGGLTIIVEHAPSLIWDLGDSRGTVAVRMPAHPVALELLKRTGPLAVSSANKSGVPAAHTAENAREQLGELVTVYLDGGPAPDDTMSSTIVDLTGPVPAIRREGTISVEAIRDVVDELMVPAKSTRTATIPASTPAAPDPAPETEQPPDQPAEAELDAVADPVEAPEAAESAPETSAGAPTDTLDGAPTDPPDEAPADTPDEAPIETAAEDVPAADIAAGDPVDPTTESAALTDETPAAEAANEDPPDPGRAGTPGATGSP